MPQRRPPSPEDRASRSDASAGGPQGGVEISVVVPARDAERTLGAALAALAAQDTDARYEVVVVDDGSADGTAALAQSAGARVLREAAAGPAAARNRGAAAAAGRLLAFTDADCEPEPGWLQAVLGALDAADLVQGRVLPPEGVAIGPYDRYISVESDHGLYETANLALTRELFERLGGFETILMPRRGKELGEDVWLGWRARRAGARTIFCEAAVVRHAVVRRGALGYVAERARLRFFPELVRRVPELRTAFHYRRVFHRRRTALFDLAAAGVLTAAATRRAWPAAFAVPYVLEARRSAAGWPRPAEVAAVQIAADAVGAAALGYGSVRSRTLLL